MSLWDMLKLSDPGLTGSQDKPELDFKTAACALLLEVAHADDNFTATEASMIGEMLQNDFGLSAEEAESLKKRSDQAREASLDLYSFTEALNTQSSKGDRILIVERLWEIIYSDGRLDGHEDHLIHRLAELLQLEHKELIDAKIRVKRALDVR